MSSSWDFSKHLRRPNIVGSTHGIAAGHILASQAGLQILENGGNAIDAGVCAGLVLNVVESQQCSFSGVAPIIVYLRDTDQAISIDGLGTWPAAASIERLTEQGHDHVPGGIEATVVPGAPDAWITALDRYGTLSFAEVAAAAIRYARDGFYMYDGMAQTVAARESEFPAGTEAHRILFPGGAAPVEGQLFKQVDLADSLTYMADEEAAASGKGRSAGLKAARDAFYKGDIAKAFVSYHQRHNGLLTMEDLAEYSVSIEEPLNVDFRGTRVYSCGPWSQGPMLLQQLNVLHDIDLEGLGHNSAGYIHTLVETIKLVAQDRERFYGDPKFVDVPLPHLLSATHAAELRNQIDPKRANTFTDPFANDNGLVTAGESGRLYNDTTYVSVVDQWGNAFSATPSDGVMHLSPVVPGTGMAVSPRGVQSRLNPAHPAALGPGRRPRLTPNPALARHRDGTVMPFGTPGGDLQTQAMLQFLLNHTVFGMNPQQAIEAPRVYSYDFPDSFAPHRREPRVVRVEDPFPASVADELTQRGHVVKPWPVTEWPLTSVTATSSQFAEGRITAAADFRRHAYALGR
ncbi:gamma-glutamyltranspeptidase [Arthrobacter crystallopoietes BAB-32]|uniref:Gamma-glutamyltranspeptidase n=1 Tax=Arthrobacter crystallopoietes BAB-32 TaxID=1246476 RepID=N1V4E9_9MICC|nr:gamma-glutamyltransferase family protein [Arthrobacter crystallopoietes]EMY34879.1 gamma-glutamyltranspeptidase [Arthrobacter crystallopoietes BAB-32]